MLLECNLISKSMNYLKYFKETNNVLQTLKIFKFEVKNKNVLEILFFYIRIIMPCHICTELVHKNLAPIETIMIVKVPVKTP